MKIGKVKARLAANDLTKKLRQQYEEYRTGYIDFVVACYNESLPQEVHAFAKKYPQYVGYSESIYFDGYDLLKESVHPDISVISNRELYAQAILELTEDMANSIKKMRNKYLDTKKEYEKLRKETETVLLNLGTTKRIEKEFPLAAPFFASSIPIKNALPVVDVSNLKTRLLKLQKQ